VALFHDFLHETNTLINFVIASHKRILLLTDLRRNLESATEPAQIPSTSIRTLCPTRWTMQTSVKSLLVNSSLLMELFTSLTENEPGEIGAKARGFHTTLTQLTFLFCLKVFQPAEFASKFLQTRNIIVAAALTAV
jgi:hypothetical protein